ncbi:hypothetical protein ABKV19_019625 [Rosa sericea]
MENLRVKELQVSGLSGGERPHEVDPPSELGTPAATETMSTEWTDEKHSMYLKSMEASFVNQLYNSMDTRGRHKGNLSHIKSSKQPQFNSRAASGQFKVLRGGCWQKINFGRGEAEVNNSDQPCGDLLANPWILHFRSTCKPKDVESPILQEQAAAICEEVDSSLKKEITSAPATCSKQFNVSHSHLMHQDMVGGNTGAFSYILLCFPLIIVGNLCVAIFSYSAAFDWCFGVPVLSRMLFVGTIDYHPA